MRTRDAARFIERLSTSLDLSYEVGVGVEIDDFLKRCATVDAFRLHYERSRYIVEIDLISPSYANALAVAKQLVTFISYADGLIMLCGENQSSFRCQALSWASEGFGFRLDLSISTFIRRPHQG